MIRTKRDVWVASIAITLMVSAVVFPVVFYLTSVEDRWHDIPISGGMTIALSFGFAHFMARQVHRNYELAEELGRLLERDRLTDVATRDFFYSRMAEAPDAYGLSLMIDIDHFKSVNDTYGHAAGDSVIRHVAQVLRHNCRGNDIVCRFGGEEFVVFLFGVDRENAYDVAERIRQSVEYNAAEHDGLPVKVTVSIGGSLKERTDQIDRAIMEADAALYKAKELGRNRSIMSWLSLDDKPGKAAA